MVESKEERCASEEMEGDTGEAGADEPGGTAEEDAEVEAAAIASAAGSRSSQWMESSCANHVICFLA